MWISSNIKDSVKNNVNLEITFQPYFFKPLGFWEAASKTAIDIANKHENIYLTLSGGLDSEFIFTVFYENKIPFTPVIYLTNHNQMETFYAFHLLKKCNITPIVLSFDDNDSKKIQLKYVNDGLITTNGMYHLYIQHQFPDAVVIDGIDEPFPATNFFFHISKSSIEKLKGFDDYFVKPSMQQVIMGEYMFYRDYYDMKPKYSFFTFYQEMYWACLKEYDWNLNTQEAKSKLYNLACRPKLRPDNINSEDISKVYSNLYGDNMRINKVVYTLNELLDILRPFVINEA